MYKKKASFYEIIFVVAWFVWKRRKKRRTSRTNFGGGAALSYASWCCGVIYWATDILTGLALLKNPVYTEKIFLVSTIPQEQAW